MKISKAAVVFVLFFSSLVWAQSSTHVVSDAEATEIMCVQNKSISDHMQNMGAIIWGLNETVKGQEINTLTEEELSSAIRDTQLLRVHLASVFNLTPAKILAIDEKDPEGSKLIFQGYLHKVMGLTLGLESELRKKPAGAQEAKMQNIHVDAHIEEIFKTVEQAHKLYRK